MKRHALVIIRAIRALLTGSKRNPRNPGIWCIYNAAWGRHEKP